MYLAKDIKGYKNIIKHSFLRRVFICTILSSQLISCINTVVKFFFSSFSSSSFPFVSNKKNLKNFDKAKEISVRHCTQFHLDSTIGTTNFIIILSLD